MTRAPGTRATGLRYAGCAAVLAATLALAGCSSSSGRAEHTVAGAPDPVRISTQGNRLVGPNGHTLYTNSIDTAAAIRCSDQCAAQWSPLLGSPVISGPLPVSDFGTATRPDGGTQVTYNGRPLYYFVDDSATSVAGNGRHDGGATWQEATVASAIGQVGTLPSAAPSS